MFRILQRTTQIYFLLVLIITITLSCNSNDKYQELERKYNKLKLEQSVQRHESEQLLIDAFKSYIQEDWETAEHLCEKIYKDFKDLEERKFAQILLKKIKQTTNPQKMKKGIDAEKEYRKAVRLYLDGNLSASKKLASSIQNYDSISGDAEILLRRIENTKFDSIIEIKYHKPVYEGVSKYHIKEYQNYTFKEEPDPQYEHKESYYGIQPILSPDEKSLIICGLDNHIGPDYLKFFNGKNKCEHYIELEPTFDFFWTSDSRYFTVLGHKDKDFNCQPTEIRVFNNHGELLNSFNNANSINFIDTSKAILTSEIINGSINEQVVLFQYDFFTKETQILHEFDNDFTFWHVFTETLEFPKGIVYTPKGYKGIIYKMLKPTDRNNEKYREVYEYLIGFNGKLISVKEIKNCALY